MPTSPRIPSRPSNGHASMITLRPRQQKRHWRWPQMAVWWQYGRLQLPQVRLWSTSRHPTRNKQLTNLLKRQLGQRPPRPPHAAKWALSWSTCQLPGRWCMYRDLSVTSQQSRLSTRLDTRNWCSLPKSWQARHQETRWIRPHCGYCPSTPWPPHHKVAAPRSLNRQRLGRRNI
jgi:hypothetical protein